MLDSSNNKGPFYLVHQINLVLLYCYGFEINGSYSAKICNVGSILKSHGAKSREGLAVIFKHIDPTLISCAAILSLAIYVVNSSNL